MCETITGKKTKSSFDNVVSPVTAELITEDKAHKVLERLDMFKKLRQEVIIHPNLDERMLLALETQDLPDWWVPGKHDKDLLFGVARHGIIRMEYHILNDQDLSFKDIMKRHLSGESLVNLKEKKLYDDMRMKAAAAREEMEASKKEDVAEIKDDKDAGDDLVDTKEADKNAPLTEEA